MHVLGTGLAYNRSVLTYLNLDLISSGNTKRLYMILKPKFKEPEIEVGMRTRYIGY